MIQANSTIGIGLLSATIVGSHEQRPTPFAKVRQGPIAADKIMSFSILGFLLMTRLPTALRLWFVAGLMGWMAGFALAVHASPEIVAWGRSPPLPSGLSNVVGIAY
jgi:hypothetical protein